MKSPKGIETTTISRDIETRQDPVNKHNIEIDEPNTTIICRPLCS